MAAEGGYRVNPTDRSHEIPKLTPLSDKDEQEKKKQQQTRKRRAARKALNNRNETIQETDTGQGESGDDEHSMDYYA